VSGEGAAAGKGSERDSSSPTPTVINPTPEAPPASPAAPVSVAASPRVSPQPLTPISPAGVGGGQSAAGSTAVGTDTDQLTASPNPSFSSAQSVAMSLGDQAEEPPAGARFVAGPRAAARLSLTKPQLPSVRIILARAGFAGPLNAEAKRRVGPFSVSATPAADVGAGPDRWRLSGLRLVPNHKSGRRASATPAAPSPDSNPASTTKALLVATGTGTSVPALALVALIVVIAPAFTWYAPVHIGFSAATRVDPVPAHPG